MEWAFKQTNVWSVLILLIASTPLTALILESHVKRISGSMLQKVSDECKNLDWVKGQAYYTRAAEMMNLFKE
jgi:hypothetical protein